MANVVDGRRTVAGELKETGQRLLTTDTYANMSAVYRYVSHIRTVLHVVLWLQVEHWVY